MGGVSILVLLDDRLKGDLVDRLVRHNVPFQSLFYWMIVLKCGNMVQFR